MAIISSADCPYICQAAEKEAGCGGDGGSLSIDVKKNTKTSKQKNSNKHYIFGSPDVNVLSPKKQINRYCFFWCCDLVGLLIEEVLILGSLEEVAPNAHRPCANSRIRTLSLLREKHKNDLRIVHKTHKSIGIEARVSNKFQELCFCKVFK